MGKWYEEVHWEIRVVNSIYLENKINVFMLLAKTIYTSISLMIIVEKAIYGLLWQKSLL